MALPNPFSPIAALFNRWFQVVDRRREYRAKIRLIYEDLRREHELEVGRHYMGTVEQVRKSSIEVAEYIKPGNRADFEKAWQKYCDTSAKTGAPNSCVAQAVRIAGAECKSLKEQLLEEINLLLRYSS